MGFTYMMQLPSSAEIMRNYPATEKVKAVKARRDQAIQAILTGQSDKFLV
jgi:3-deoxy-7-phosphoheptulonate synthase